MRQLNIISGAGINLGISAVCPEATEITNFTYQKSAQAFTKELHLKLGQCFPRILLIIYWVDY